MGNGIQASLNKARVEIKELDRLLFIHHHMDHNEKLTPIFIRSILGGNNFMLAGPASTSDFASSIMNLYTEDMNYRIKNSGRTVEDVKNKYNAKNLKGVETFTSRRY
ncbi:hypothetical protein GCM10022393_35950 [Aquimarina addita]|uniref:Uncharacterized protein n=1 Tax=Aquimarina addita TaxID=870485 RepID=A0ABP6UUT6_9FLAO